MLQSLSALKPLSKSITSAFKLIYKQIESYNLFDLWYKVLLDNFKQSASDKFY